MLRKVSNWMRPKLVLVVSEDEDKGIKVGSNTGEIKTGSGGHSNIVTEL